MQRIFAQNILFNQFIKNETADDMYRSKERGPIEFRGLTDNPLRHQNSMDFLRYPCIEHFRPAILFTSCLKPFQDIGTQQRLTLFFRNANPLLSMQCM